MKKFRKPRNKTQLYALQVQNGNRHIQAQKCFWEIVKYPLYRFIVSLLLIDQTTQNKSWFWHLHIVLPKESFIIYKAPGTKAVNTCMFRVVEFPHLPAFAVLHQGKQAKPQFCTLWEKRWAVSCELAIIRCDNQRCSMEVFYSRSMPGTPPRPPCQSHRFASCTTVTPLQYWMTESGDGWPSSGPLILISIRAYLLSINRAPSTRNLLWQWRGLKWGRPSV